MIFALWMLECFMHDDDDDTHHHAHLVKSIELKPSDNNGNNNEQPNQNNGQVVVKTNSEKFKATLKRLRSIFDNQSFLINFIDSLFYFTRD